jgi:hypothetical protein
MPTIKTLLDDRFACRSAPVHAFRAAVGTMMVGLVTVLAALPGNAQDAGSVQIEGHADHLQVRLENAPIAKVLAELGRRFGLTYGRVPSINRQLTGRYSGALKQVLARVLDGTDYIVEFSDQSVKVVFLGVSGPPARAGSQPATPVAQNPTPTTPQPSDGAGPPTTPANPSVVQVPPLTNFLSDANSTRPSGK